MNLQLTTLATWQELATSTARFQMLASIGLDHHQKLFLDQKLNDNLSFKIDTLAHKARLRIGVHPISNQTVKIHYKSNSHHC